MKMILHTYKVVFLFLLLYTYKHGLTDSVEQDNFFSFLILRLQFSVNPESQVEFKVFVPINLLGFSFYSLFILTIT